ncbi:MAG: peptidylprolyl isomerase [Candidatus Nanoarchaeia archaeon]|nr:peptidylprolyl isomerase [Candidatus Nanoarchaeia archaeon]
MALQKNDFVEIEFTGRVKNGEIFDTNSREDLEKLHHGHDHEVKSEPFALCLGQGMFLKGVEEFLVGKPETPATYELELSPENAFGRRNPQLIQRIPLKIFRQQNLNPVPGFAFNFDGRIGRVLASSGGRVIVDFNNPIAGKDVVYKIKILRKIEDMHEKARALIKFLFREDLKSEIKEKKITMEVEKPLVEFVKLFHDKFKEMLDLDLEVKETAEKPKNSEKSAEIGVQ